MLLWRESEYTLSRDAIFQRLKKRANPLVNEVKQVSFCLFRTEAEGEPFLFRMTGCGLLDSYPVHLVKKGWVSLAGIPEELGLRVLSGLPNLKGDSLAPRLELFAENSTKSSSASSTVPELR